MGSGFRVWGLGLRVWGPLADACECGRLGRLVSLWGAGLPEER